MKVTLVPTIRNGSMTQLQVQFDTPLGSADSVKILEKLQEQLEDPSLFLPRVHTHLFSDTPFYSKGELIAVVRRCVSCGFTTRDYP